MKQILIDAFLPLFATMASVFVPLLIAYAVERFRAWTGIEIEARHREALQSALANAARIVLAGASRDAGINYVLASVPDALKALGAEDAAKIGSLLEPHLATSASGALAR